MKLYREKVYRKNKFADEARLKRIVDKCNWFVSQGERLPICIGHTTPNLKPCEACDGTGKLPDKECPACEGTGMADHAAPFLPVDVGSMSNFSEDGEWVYSDWDIDDAFGEAVKRHRGKSAEVWQDDLIYPLSLVSYNRPKQMLGPHKYTREGDSTTLTINDEEPDMLTEEAVKNMISECLLNSDLQGQVKSLMDTVGQLQIQVQNHSEQSEALKWLFEDEEEGGDELGENAPEVDPSAPADPTGEGAPEETGGEPKEPTGEGAPEIEKNDLGMVAPSGTNTFVPSTGTGAKKPEEENRMKKNYEELELERQTYFLEAENAKKLAADYATRIEGISAAAEAAKAEASQAIHKYAMEHRRNELLILHEKYEFDVDREMEIVEPMTDEQFERHKTVVTKYAAPPVHSAPISVGELPKPAAAASPYEKIIPKDVSAKVISHATKHKQTFNVAYKEVMGVDPP